MRRWLWTIAAAFLTVAVLSRLIWGSVVQRLPLPDFGVRAAAFGDIAGALFSALAFALLIVTALMQREELSLQREELRETRAELKRTAEAQEGSERALQAQVDTARVAAKLNALASLLDNVAKDPDLIPPNHITGPSLVDIEIAERAKQLKQQIGEAITELEELAPDLSEGGRRDSSRVSGLG